MFGPVALITADKLSSFVGRDAELRALNSVLQHGQRLVTLIGPGGIGKTRLAVRLADALADRYPDGTVFVALDALADGCLVTESILQAAGAELPRSSDPLETLTAALGAREMLLLLDNCEHLLDTVAPTVQHLIARCPRLTVLATSREPIGVGGEHLHPVPPLPVQPDGDTSEPPAAVTLFLDRAEAASPGISHRPGTLDAAAGIVATLDGIPLAIELAAARVRAQTPREIADTLTDRLDLLTAAPRHGIARQRTLRDSIAWSYALLDDDQRRLFRRLAVFPDGWTLAAAETVCADPDLPGAAVFAALGGLVDKSLVHATPGSDGTRYRMLTTVRRFALEHLDAADERVDIAQRHCAYFTDVAARARQEVWALDPQDRARLDVEAANLRDAVRHACSRGDVAALRITGDLGHYWRLQGRLTEGIGLTERALAAHTAGPCPERAEALAMLSTLTFWRGDFARTGSAIEEALAIAAVCDAPAAQAHALMRLGCATMLTDPARGDAILGQANDLAEQAGDDLTLSTARACLVLSSLFRSDYQQLGERAADSLALSLRIGFESDARWTSWALAHQALAAGDTAAARALADHGLAMDGDDPFSRACLTETLALADLRDGQPDQAHVRAATALADAHSETVRLGIGALEHALAKADLALGDDDAASRRAAALFAHEQDGAGYLAWHAQEVLMTSALVNGDTDAARTHAGILQALAALLNNCETAIVAGLGLARADLLDSDLRSAEQHARAATASAHEHRLRDLLTVALETLAAVLAATGRTDRACALFSATEGLRPFRGLTAHPREQAYWQATIADTRARTGSHCDQHWQRGRHLTPEQLAELVTRGRGERTVDAAADLTAVERRVAELAASGLTNPAIAERLYVSRSTVKAHLSHAFAKLGVTNRTELAGLFVAASGDTTPVEAAPTAR